MCGIAGIATWKAGADVSLLAEKMTSPIFHRGPDDFGIWSDSQAGVAFGHRRLAILDLSPHGHQPMVSASGRYTIAYNGEIYNFKALKIELAACGWTMSWRGESDTEVLLAAIELWGIKEALRKVVGMFAFALWDRESSTVLLARDRVGEKPLYYGYVDGNFVFASELKAIHSVFKHSLKIDRISLSEFVRYGYVPAPSSIYSNIFKLKPGHFVVVGSSVDSAEAVPYWDIKSGDKKELGAELRSMSDKGIIELTSNTLMESVKGQMVSDVPIGAFLSGGIDSSLVVSLMQAQSARKIKTYTIGFEETEFDEAPYARAISNHLGTDHVELYVGAKDALQVIPDLPDIYDEPFADSSQLPTVLVSRLTKEHVTVALSGDGGDELFAGYPRYEVTANLWRKISSLPLPLRRAAAATLKTMSSRSWDKVCSILPAGTQKKINGRRIYRMSELFGSTSLSDMYTGLMSQWQRADNLVLGVDGTPQKTVDWYSGADFIEEMRRWDFNQYLPDDLLVKVDRAAMSASLETRAPLLDHRMVELAFAMPTHHLIKNGVRKWPLRAALEQHVPSTFFDRPKSGFSIPLAQWLRGELREWAGALLDHETLKSQGYFDADKVTQAWRQHLQGTYDRSLHLWNILMFQAWLERQSKKEQWMNI
ncbi:asparagine synthase (glutamine-hydrolyzing) [Pseudomonas quasicaspiana]|uniref:asparagine synthase (glutamine-hydrolyzing) n=1 Tax=Pseudomonas quasicaspiana TaxID=2829821 RepID=UPI0022286051|nr:asparagine synthase (glutamine-hydrolyzing) [Pseudomonas quasicaspiana]MCD5978828.1 asparagine synthase (glutamine-hydrolyzing) [Pseudomonas quasicaspiana]